MTPEKFHEIRLAVASAYTLIQQHYASLQELATKQAKLREKAFLEVFPDAGKSYFKDSILRADIYDLSWNGGMLKVTAYESGRGSSQDEYCYEFELSQHMLTEEGQQHIYNEYRNEFLEDKEAADQKKARDREVEVERKRKLFNQLKVELGE